MSRANFKFTARREVDALRERKGISDAPGQASAINIAPYLPDAEGGATEALPGAAPGPVNLDQTLPEFQRASAIDPKAIARSKPPLLIENLLHRECKMVLAGGSKTYKSWALVDLGISVATGKPWWGLNCAQGVVMYINFELIPGFLDERIYRICHAKGVALPEWFLYWNLRHKCYDLRKVALVLRERILRMQARVDLIIVDPIYKALGGLEENSASDMAELMYTIEHLSAETRAAVVFGAHFSKGAQAQKEPKDRISGSGVFGRDPDAIMTMTRHASPLSYVVESDLRYVKPLDDFVVTWNFPLMMRDEGKNPEELWVPGTVRKSEKDASEPLTAEDVLSVITLHTGGVQDGLWKEEVRRTFGKAGNAYYLAKKQLIEDGRVIKRGLKYLPASFVFDTD